MYQKGTLYASVQVLGKYPSVITVHHAGEENGENAIAGNEKNSCLCAPFPFSLQAVDH